MCYGIDGDDDPYWRDGDCFGDVEMVNFELSNCDYIWEQSTGLLDKNGKEIFEGDIVTNESLIGVVEYKVDVYCVWTVGTTTDGVVLLSSNWLTIGNIHENPELLGGKE